MYELLSAVSIIKKVMIYFDVYPVCCFVTIRTVYFSCLYWMYVLLMESDGLVQSFLYVEKA